MSVRILQGDCREVMRTLEAESVDCVVTSPPYWGLRDYGVEGQLGMEPTLGEHIETMVDVCREVRRVLSPEGTFWLNYGDCYATTPNGRSAADTKDAGNDDRTFRDKPFSTVGPINRGKRQERGPGRRGGGNAAAGPIRDANCRQRTPGGIRADRRENSGARIVAGGTLKPKDLCMVPNRLAIALQDDGWWVRSEIIWHKPNPMPESIKDRPAVAHEKVWLLTKGARYRYDADAVRTPQKGESIARLGRARTGTHAPGQPPHGGIAGPRNPDKQRGHPRRHAGFNDRWDQMSADEQRAKGANLRNVWSIATAPFSGAHFATFPPALVEPCIKAGCPEGGIVLDPFGGAGTTGLVADRLNRNAILIELNPDYAKMAERRIHDDAPLFVEPAA